MRSLAWVGCLLLLGVALAAGCASSGDAKKRSRNEVYWGGGSKHADSFPGASHRPGYGAYRGRPPVYRY